MLGAIAGAIAESFYDDIPQEILKKIYKKLSSDLWYITLSFYQRYGITRGTLKMD